ncbi:MAG: hypothetical protein EP348_01285 [Alphaproteobacteria bacterium]|nr:MAG: hypothetical protein EP348_01285 [Alphaproteobacteria bacterium]
MSRFLVRIIFAFSLVMAGFTPALAQQKEPRALGTFNDWLAYSWIENGHKVCYMLSRPTKSLPTNVNRGDIYLMVTFRPQSKSKEEVSHVTGYPYKKNSTAEVEIGNKKYTLATDKDVAWVPENQSDETLIKAMKRGAKLVIRGRSERGTLTTDTYSLQGFTAAHRQIRKSCT